MFTLQQAFDTAWKIVTERTPWRCQSEEYPGGLWISTREDGTLFGCFIGQAMLDYSRIEEVLVGPFTMHPLFAIPMHNLLRDDDRLRELAVIHDALTEQDRGAAKELLVNFAVTYGLSIPLQKPVNNGILEEGVSV